MKTAIDRNVRQQPALSWPRPTLVYGRRAEATTRLRADGPGASDGAAATATIRAASRYEAAPARVFDAWIEPAVARRWLFATATQPDAHVDIDGRIGGAFRVVDGRVPRPSTYTGRYLEFVAGRRLAFTLVTDHACDAVTRVSITISAMAKGCLLELCHDDVPARRACDVECRWSGLLYGLGETLDAAFATSCNDEDRR